MDPLADEFEHVSPYNYGMNNPILMIDPDGMAVDTIRLGQVKIFGRRINPWKVIRTNLKFDKGTHQLAKEIGGVPQARFANSNREFDAISDKLIG